MTLLKCKCGRFTQNGFLCTNCQKDTSIDTLTYEPESSSEDEVDKEILDEIDFFIAHEYDTYDED